MSKSLDSRIKAAARKQQGFTLIELAIVLAIAAIIGILIFMRMTKVQNANIANNESSNLAMMVSDARTKFSNQGDYAGVSAAVLINNGLVPQTMVSGATIKTGWGTGVTVAPSNLNGTANDGIKFTYTVPKKNCSDFVTGAAAAVSKITIGTTVVKNAPAGSSTLDMTALGTACDASAAGTVAAAFEQGV